MPIQFIYFDCMDTLIQMDVPSMEVYPDWAFEACRGLGLWADEVAFRVEWKLHRERFQSLHGAHREGTARGRMRDLLRDRVQHLQPRWSPLRIEEEANRAHERYWSRYRQAAFVLPEVPAALQRIQRRWRVPLGVLSNFMIEGGISALLAEHGLDQFFQVVLVSCEHGWRKPAPAIYESALQAAGADPGEILFVGDDLAADYQGASAAGMLPLLYDRRRAYPQVERRIESMHEIEGWLQAAEAMGT